MTNILLVTSSPRGADSLSTRFATELAEGIQTRTQGTLHTRHLGAQPVPHITPAYINGRMLPGNEQTPEQAEAVGLARELIAELQAADTVVIGSGMINFGLPSQLKAWFDHITWPGVTFSYGDAGPQGLLSGKKVYVVTASGGVFSEGSAMPYDFQTQYLFNLLGFIGLSDTELVRIEGTALGRDAANTAISVAGASVSALLDKVAV